MHCHVQTARFDGKHYVLRSRLLYNGTWTLQDLLLRSPGKRTIPLRRVFLIKRDAKGKFEKYECRIVIRGQRLLKCWLGL
jgi:hypothetical protein